MRHALQPIAKFDHTRNVSVSGLAGDGAQREERNKSFRYELCERTHNHSPGPYRPDRHERFHLGSHAALPSELSVGLLCDEHPAHQSLEHVEHGLHAIPRKESDT
jgi:hypothetical protein